VQVANQSAPVSASPHAPQSLPALAKTHETGVHTPFSVILGEQVRTEAVQAPVPTPSRVSDDPRQETDEAAASLNGEIPPGSDSPAGLPQKLQQPLLAAKAIPNLNRPVQHSANGPVASLGEKPLPESAIPPVGGKEKAVSSETALAGPAQQRSKEEKHEDSGISGRGTAPAASEPPPVSHVTAAETNIDSAIPASLMAENTGLSLPVTKLPAETPTPIGHTPVVPGAVPSSSAAGATTIQNAGVRMDEKNSSVSSSDSPGPDIATTGGVTSEIAPLNSKPEASSPNDASPLQHPQGDTSLRAEEKRPQTDSSPASSTRAADSGTASLPANAVQHGAPAQVGASAQVAGMTLNVKHHDEVPVSSTNGAQANTSTGSPSPSAGMQGGENAAKPASSPNVAANPFTKLDQDPNADAIVLHSTAQRITVGVPHPSLGWVEINTQSAGDRVAATLVSASTQTHQHLAEQLPSLTQYLADREVKVSSVAVHQETAGSDGGGSSNAHNSQERDGASSSRPKLQVASAQPLQGDGRNEIQDGRRLSYIDIHA
jgi:hypothetical protein